MLIHPLPLSVFNAQVDEFENIMNKQHFVQMDTFIKLRGLPYSTTPAEIEKFFDGKYALARRLLANHLRTIVRGGANKDEEWKASIYRYLTIWLVDLYNFLQNMQLEQQKLTSLKRMLDGATTIVCLVTTKFRKRRTYCGGRRITKRAGVSDSVLLQTLFWQIIPIMSFPRIIQITSSPPFVVI